MIASLTEKQVEFIRKAMEFYITSGDQESEHHIDDTRILQQIRRRIG